MSDSIEREQGSYLLAIIITMARKTAANLNTHHLDLRI